VTLSGDLMPLSEPYIAELRARIKTLEKEKAELMKAAGKVIAELKAKHEGTQRKLTRALARIDKLLEEI